MQRVRSPLDECHTSQLARELHTSPLHFSGPNMRCTSDIRGYPFKRRSFMRLRLAVFRSHMSISETERLEA